MVVGAAGWDVGTGLEVGPAGLEVGAGRDVGGAGLVVGFVVGGGLSDPVLTGTAPASPMPIPAAKAAPANIV
jgi:hypothetical protein